MPNPSTNDRKSQCFVFFFFFRKLCYFLMLSSSFMRLHQMTSMSQTLNADEVIFGKEYQKVSIFLKNTNVLGLWPFFSVRKKTVVQYYHG